MGYTHGDDITVTIENRTTMSDGSGFFGMLNLPPGDYRVENCPIQIAAGRVTRIDLPCSN